ncbi:MAG: tetratricopeptide repeat protein, partial [Gemmatimonadota bacterium]
MAYPRGRERGRLYSALLTVFIALVVAMAGSALYVSAGGELFGWSGGVFGIDAPRDSTTRVLERAREAAGAGRYGEALAAYDTALAWAPSPALARERAKVLAWAERYGEAADALAAIGDEADVETMLERARLLWWADRPREADSLLSLVLARHPDAAEARELQDLVRPSVEPALDVATRWVQERPGDPFSRLWLARVLVREGRQAEALAHYRAALGRAGTAEPEVLLEAAGVAVGVDSLRFAGEVLARYLNDVDPGDLETRLRLARAYSWSGRYDAAEAEYRRVLAARPDPAVRLELARMLASAGRHESAIGELRQVLAAAPSADVRRDLVRSLAAAGRYDRALGELAPLLEERQQERDLLERARILALAERYGEAADVLAAVIEGRPADAGIRLRRARYLWWAGRLEAADAALTDLLRLRPGAAEVEALREEIRLGIDPSIGLAREWLALDDTPRNRRRLAEALLKAERYAEALEHYRVYLAAKPEPAPELFRTVSEVAEAADSLRLAATLLERHLEAAPGAEPDALLRLARLHAWSDRPERAVDAFGRYLELRPADREARFELARQLAWQDTSRWPAATAELERVLRADSAHAPALKLLGDLARWRGDADA